MFTTRCNSYVAFLVANNIFSNNLKYFSGRKSHNSFGSMKVKPFYGNGVSFKAYLLPFKKPLCFIQINRSSREIS